MLLNDILRGALSHEKKEQTQVGIEKSIKIRVVPFKLVSPAPAPTVEQL
jgi:hypothetical protein